MHGFSGNKTISGVYRCRISASFMARVSLALKWESGQVNLEALIVFYFILNI